MSTADVVDAWEREVQDRGRREGIAEGVKKSLIAVYQGRFGAVPSDVRAAVEGMRDEVELSGWVQLFATHSAEEIAAAVRVNDRPS